MTLFSYGGKGEVYRKTQLLRSLGMFVVGLIDIWPFKFLGGWGEKVCRKRGQGEWGGVMESMHAIDLLVTICVARGNFV